jgi:hypothetical protein
MGSCLTGKSNVEVPAAAGNAKRATRLRKPYGALLKARVCFVGSNNTPFGLGQLHPEKGPDLLKRAWTVSGSVSAAT